MRKHSLLLIPIISFLISSCSIYKQEFDCEPPIGVPCTSETDLEAMIVETNKGPDLFLPVEKEEYKLPCTKRTKIPTERIAASLSRKVWFCNQSSEEGYHVQGHYIYQAVSPINTEDDCCPAAYYR